MFHRLKIIMPPPLDVYSTVHFIMAPFGIWAREGNEFFWDSEYTLLESETFSTILGGDHCDRLIIAKPMPRDERVMKPVFMVSKEFWNGVSHLRTAWSGTIGEALLLAERFAKPADDWLVVTVEYHN